MCEFTSDVGDLLGSLPPRGYYLGGQASLLATKKSYLIDNIPR